MANSKFGIKRVYYVETQFGCGLRAAHDIREVRAEMKREMGAMCKSVRRATEKDRAWVGSMGGRVPEGVYDK